MLTWFRIANISDIAPKPKLLLLDIFASLEPLAVIISPRYQTFIIAKNYLKMKKKRGKNISKRKLSSKES